MMVFLVGTIRVMLMVSVVGRLVGWLVSLFIWLLLHHHRGVPTARIPLTLPLFLLLSLSLLHSLSLYFTLSLSLSLSTSTSLSLFLSTSLSLSTTLSLYLYFSLPLLLSLFLLLSLSTSASLSLYYYYSLYFFLSLLLSLSTTLSLSVPLSLPLLLSLSLSLSRSISLSLSLYSLSLYSLSLYLSTIFLRKSSRHQKSAQSGWKYVFADRPKLVCPCVGVHRRKSIVSSSLPSPAVPTNSCLSLMDVWWEASNRTVAVYRINSKQCAASFYRSLFLREFC